MSTLESLQSVQTLTTELTKIIAQIQPKPRERKRALLEDQTLPPKFGSCDLCKKLRIKCNKAINASELDPCNRCINLNLNCYYSPQAKPGRPYKNYEDNIAIRCLDQLQQELSHAIQSLQESKPSTSTSIPSPPLPSQSLINHVASSTNGINEEEIVTEDLQLLENPLAVLATMSGIERDAQSLPFSHQILPINELTEEDQSIKTHFESGLYPIRSDLDWSLDPINCGILTLVDVHRLVNFYFEHLEPFMYMLDASIHTTEFIRARSPFLLSAICAASAQYDPLSRPFLNAISNHAMQLSLRVLQIGFKSLEIIQAFSLLAHWSPLPSRWEFDRSWFWIGLAIRLFTELRLDYLASTKLSQQQSNSLNENDQTFLKNCQQTYRMLFVFDTALSVQSGRSRSIIGNNILLDPIAPDPTPDQGYNTRANTALRQILVKGLDLAINMEKLASKTGNQREQFLISWQPALNQWWSTWTNATPYLKVIWYSTKVTLLCTSLRFAGPARPILDACMEAGLETLNLLKGWFPKPLFGSNFLIMHISYTTSVLLKLCLSRKDSKVSRDVKMVMNLCDYAIELFEEIGRMRSYNSVASLHSVRLNQLLKVLKSRESSLLERDLSKTESAEGFDLFQEWTNLWNWSPEAQPINFNQPYVDIDNEALFWPWESMGPTENAFNQL